MKLINTFTIFSLLFAVTVPTAQAVEEKTEVTEEVPLAQSTEEKKSDSLTDLSLEELMNIQVVTASKMATSVFKSPSAIFVITQDDIRRSGMNSLPDLFRMVPGMHVAHQDGSTWAISTRGFNGVLANKLLVMIDGRSIYNTNFNGTYWDQTEIPLEDIERIEVIRGPGGTLWGSNAVNGIINIITKSAKDTEGGLVVGTAGYSEFGSGTIRYGGKSGDNFFYRMYGKYFYRDEMTTRSGGIPANDYWQMGRVGFRIDSDLSNKDLLTVTGDGYFGREAHTEFDIDLTTPPFNFLSVGASSLAGGHVLGKWNHEFSEKSDFEVQLSYARTQLNYTSVDILENGLHFDVQHRFHWGSRQQLIWGAGYRFLNDNTIDHQKLFYVPDDSNQNLFTGFIQDEITIVPERLTFTVGTKLEHNQFSGFEYQPSGRFMWTPNDIHGVWLAGTRAVKTPSRLQEEVTFRNTAFTDPATGLPVAIAGVGADVTSEKVISGELGYRVRPTSWINFDLAGFFNHYDDVLAFGTGSVPVSSFETSPVPHVQLANPFNNDVSGQTYGLELATNIELAKWWTVHTGFSWLEVNMHDDTGANATEVNHIEENDPRILANVRSQIDLPHNIEWDTSFYFASDIGEQEVFGNQMGVDEVTRLDVQVSWKPKDNLRLSLVGQNLIQSQESEFNDFAYNAAATDVPRTFYGKVAWEF